MKLQNWNIKKKTTRHIDTLQVFIPYILNIYVVHRRYDIDFIYFSGVSVMFPSSSNLMSSVEGFSDFFFLSFFFHKK